MALVSTCTCKLAQGSNKCIVIVFVDNKRARHFQTVKFDLKTFIRTGYELNKFSSFPSPSEKVLQLIGITTGARILHILYHLGLDINRTIIFFKML